MTFTPKYIPYVEAERIVGERIGIKKDQINPLRLACEEGKILPEIKRNGKWKRLANGEWSDLNIFWPNPYVQTLPREDEIALSEIRFLMLDIDGLWPPTGFANNPATPGYQPPYMQLMNKAIERFQITDQNVPKKEDLVDYFLKQCLPDNSPISKRMAEAMTTAVRPQSAMKGGNRRLRLR